MTGEARTVLIVASYGRSLVNFRGDLIAALVAAGYRVICAAPALEAETRAALEALGARTAEYPLARSGLNPLADLHTMVRLRALIRRCRADVVFPYTIKPVIYASLAARLEGVPVVAFITGLGFTFSGASRAARALQPLTTRLYRTALREAHAVIFQNADDRRLFAERGIVDGGLSHDVVGGSGVNLERYPARTQHSSGPGVRFLLLTRLIREKGVELYIDAARELRQRHPAAEFHVVGRVERTPSAIGESRLRAEHERGAIVFHGEHDGAHRALAMCDVFVLPTYYREGVPRSLLEALSAALPIVTTDTAGCRETVEEGVNGYLIPPRDGAALVVAMERFLDDPSSLGRMGRASRRRAERLFDVDVVNATLVRRIGEAVTGAHGGPPNVPGTADTVLRETRR